MSDAAEPHLLNPFVGQEDAEPVALTSRRHTQPPCSGPAPGAQRLPLPFMDSPSMSIPSPEGEFEANPPGFDRGAFLTQLADKIPALGQGVPRLANPC
jgi:hypothetical protein